MAKKKRSRNNVFLKSINELDNEINYSDFAYKEYFLHLCDLMPDKDNEKNKFKNY